MTMRIPGPSCVPKDSIECTFSVVIIAMTSYWGFADKVPLFTLVMILIQVASIPVWERMARRYSKHTLWASAWLVHSVFGLCFWFVPLSNEPS